MADSPYRQPPAVQQDPWALAWRDLRRRRVFAGFTVIAGPGLVVLLHTVFWDVYPLAVVGVLVTSLYASGFRCPKCRGVFQTWGQWSLDRGCTKCGVRSGTPAPPRLSGGDAHAGVK